MSPFWNIKFQQAGPTGIPLEAEKNLRISFMLVTKIIPIDVPKNDESVLESFSRYSGACGPQADCTSLHFTPASQASQPLTLLVPPCRISSSAFT